MRALTLAFYALVSFALSALVYVTAGTNLLLFGADAQMHRTITTLSQWLMIIGPALFLVGALTMLGPERRTDSHDRASK